MLLPHERKRWLDRCLVNGSLPGTDRYGGLTRQEYVMIAHNHRSQLLPYCPACGCSTSYQLTYFDHPRYVAPSDMAHPEAGQALDYSFRCGSCGARVTFRRCILKGRGI